MGERDKREKVYIVRISSRRTRGENCKKKIFNAIVGRQTEPHFTQLNRSIVNSHHQPLHHQPNLTKLTSTTNHRNNATPLQHPLLNLLSHHHLARLFRPSHPAALPHKRRSATAKQRDAVGRGGEEGADGVFVEGYGGVWDLEPWTRDQRL